MYNDNVTHCLFVEQEGRKEDNVLFNDAFSTFYLWLYDVGQLVKDHPDSKKGNPLPHPHRLLFPISSKGSFICTYLSNKILVIHISAFVTPIVQSVNTNMNTTKLRALVV